MSYLITFISGLIISFIIFSYTGKPECPKTYNLRSDHMFTGMPKHHIQLIDYGNRIEASYFCNNERQFYLIDYKDEEE